MDGNLLGSSGGDAGAAPVSTGDVSGDVIPFTPPEWAKGINVGQEILGAPMFSSIKSVDDVVKGYYNAQRMVGADKIVVPNKNSSSDDWRNFYVKGGLPEKFDDYKVELPKSFDDQGFNGELLKTAYENNIRPDQLLKIIGMMEGSNDKLVADYEAQQAEEIAQVGADLKKEWGQGFDKQISTANRVIKHFGGDELHKQILDSSLANNKEFLKLMASIGGKMTSEDSFQHGAVESFAMTKDEARSKVNAMYGDANSPFMNEQHAQHKEFVEKMLKYQEILSGR